jgi:phytoene/squalene synthetase
MSIHNRTEIDFAPELDFSQILTNPILDIAARFWDNERYAAFRICYRSMRLIDDLIDNRKAIGNGISERERKTYSQMITEWQHSIKMKSPRDYFQQELRNTIQMYKIPLWPWERLAAAMRYDLEHHGFSTFSTFLRYCEGAAVAPASVFMHLCGVAEHNGGYSPPAFDIRKAARPLALFSYLVHIIRDFQKDQSNHLNYFADDICAHHGLTCGQLGEITRGAGVPQSFRDMMAQYVGFAEYYRRKARSSIDLLAVHLRSRYHLSLEIVYQLYHQIFERIDPQGGGFTSQELNPTPEEVQQKIKQTIAAFQSL